MFRGPHARGSILRIRVPRTRWRPWCGGRRAARRAHGLRECGLRDADRPCLPEREAGRATGCRVERGFRAANAPESLALQARPIYSNIMPGKEPICLLADGDRDERLARVSRVAARFGVSKRQ